MRIACVDTSYEGINGIVEEALAQTAYDQLCDGFVLAASSSAEGLEEDVYLVF